MPQLDSVTFFSQFFWLCLFFVGFYLILTKHYLPTLSRLLKVRHKIMAAATTGDSLVQEELISVQQTSNTLLVDALHTTQQGLTNGFDTSYEWSENSLHKTNTDSLKAMNQKYVDSVNTMRVEQSKLHQVMKTLLAPQSHAGSPLGSTQSIQIVEKLCSSYFIGKLKNKKTNKKINKTKK